MEDGLQPELTGFGEELRALRKRARLSQARLAGKLGHQASWVSRIENGHIPPRLDLDTVWAWVVACTPGTPPGALPNEYWRKRHERMELILDLGVRAPAPTAPAPPIGAYDLGVHPEITVDSVERGTTPFIPRRHDAVLRRALADAVRDSRSLLAVVTGESCTGKTRSAFEAVRACLPNLPLRRPDRRDSRELFRLSREDFSRPTVLWLDELQMYLDPDPDEAAGALRALLAAPGPVILIGTMWTGVWRSATAAEGRARAVHDLVGDHPAVVRVKVPATLDADPGSLAALTQRDDPRLAFAHDHCHDGRAIQVLAGGAVLLDRYADAAEDAPHVWAMLTAAIDAARLGRRRFTAAYLRRTLPAYVPDGVAAPGWFERAIDHATKKVRGVSLLMPYRLSPGIGDAEGYEVHDYVLAHWMERRQIEPIAASVWEAEIEEADTGGLSALAWRANEARLLGIAERLFRRLEASGGAGATNATSGLDHLLAEQGRHDELEARIPESPGASASLAMSLQQAGETGRLRKLARRHKSWFLTRLGELLRDAGDPDAITALAVEYRDSDNGGFSSDTGHLVNLLIQGRHWPHIETLLDQRHPAALEQEALFRTQKRADSPDEDVAEALAGDLWRARDAANAMARDGCRPEAIDLLRTALAVGVDDYLLRPWVCQNLAFHLTGEGDLDGAVAALVQGAFGDGDNGLRITLKELVDDGLHDHEVFHYVASGYESLEHQVWVQTRTRKYDRTIGVFHRITEDHGFAAAWRMGRLITGDDLDALVSELANDTKLVPWCLVRRRALAAIVEKCAALPEQDGWSYEKRAIHELIAEATGNLEPPADRPDLTTSGKWKLAAHHHRRGNLAVLAALGEDGNPFAHRFLAEAYAKRHDDSRLRELVARTDDYHVTGILTETLPRDMPTPEIVDRLGRPDPDSAVHKTRRLIDHLRELGRIEDALAYARAAAAARWKDGGLRRYDLRVLVDLLIDAGHVLDTIPHLRALRDDYDWYQDKLAADLHERGRLDDLHVLAEHGQPAAAVQAALVLAETGRTEEAIARLGALTVAGVENAASHLREILGPDPARLARYRRHGLDHHGRIL